MPEKRGRPAKSIIRENTLKILNSSAVSLYGYQIYQTYQKTFEPVELRTVYYHLKKGVELGIFKIEKIIKEQGDFTWGSVSERIYYSVKK